MGNYLAGYTWYDESGNTINQQSGSDGFTKTVYDSLGRAVKQYVAYDTTEGPGTSSSSSSSSGGASQTHYGADCCS